MSSVDGSGDNDDTDDDNLRTSNVAFYSPLPSRAPVLDDSRSKWQILRLTKGHPTICKLPDCHTTINAQTSHSIQCIM